MLGEARKIEGQKIIDLYSELMKSAKDLITSVESKLGRAVESTTRAEWEELREDLDRTILALSGLEQMGMFAEEQKGLLNKLKSQQEYVADKVLPQFGEEVGRKAA